MGFNKRYVGLETIKIYMKRGGTKSLEILFSNKIDAFVFADKISSEIYNMYNRNEFRKIECLIRID
jgi:hypothetical protein